MAQARILPVNSKCVRIVNTLRVLLSMPNVSLYDAKGDRDRFWICHNQQFVPDFEFQWDTMKEQYRVYICLADRGDPEKSRRGYSICTIGSGLTAAGFVMLYQFLHKHRAHNKTESFA